MNKQGLKEAMKILLCVSLSLLIVSVQSVYAQDMEDGGMKDMFVHPFLAHMALPDRVGEVSLRLTPFQERLGAMTSSDIAFHVEAGLFTNVGLHVRNDALSHSPYSEVMLMYSFLHDSQMSRGISVFGQISIPTGPIESNTYKGLFGISARETVPHLLVIDANVHFNPEDEMAEFEGVFVFKASEVFYPIIEIRGELMENDTSVYSLMGLKFKVADEIDWGIGVQFPISTVRDYDTQMLATFGIAF